ncbi:hypothetical protein MRX96_033095 [Rhipicephalus microplus]
MVIIATCHFKDKRDHTYLSVVSQDTCRVMAEPGHQSRRDTDIYGGKASTGRNLFHLPSRTCERDGLGPLLSQDDCLNAAAYRDLLDTLRLPYALNGPFKGGLFSFQHDQSPVYTTVSIKPSAFWRRGV